MNYSMPGCSVHGFAKSQPQLSTHTYTHRYLSNFIFLFDYHVLLLGIKKSIRWRHLLLGRWNRFTFPYSHFKEHLEILDILYKTNMRRLKSEDTCRTSHPKNNLVMNCLGFIFGSYKSGVELEKQKTQMPIGIDKKQAPAKVCSL